MTLQRYRQALEGFRGVTDLPDETRTFELVRRFGWTITEADEQPPARCDWLLAMARTRDEVESKRKPS